MNKEQHSPDQKRRRFLRDATMVGAGVAVAVSLPGLAAKSGPEEEPAADQAKSQKGYRLTPHIAAYYKTMTS
jgi:nitrous oxide reductase